MVVEKQKYVGFFGGGDAFSIANQSEGIEFFSILFEHGAQIFDSHEFAVVSKRLFLDTIHPDQFEQLEGIWSELFLYLRSVQVDEAKLSRFTSKPALKNLNFIDSNWGGFFENYRLRLDDCIKRSRHQIRKYDASPTIRFGLTSKPDLYDTWDMTDEEFIGKNGKPSWAV